MKEYKPFAAHFESHFAPEIFKAYLRQVELYIGKQAWLSQRCIKLTIDFMDDWYCDHLAELIESEYIHAV